MNICDEFFVHQLCKYFMFRNLTSCHRVLISSQVSAWNIWYLSSWRWRNVRAQMGKEDNKTISEITSNEMTMDISLWQILCYKIWNKNDAEKVCPFCFFEAWGEYTCPSVGWLIVSLCVLFHCFEVVHLHKNVE